MKMLAPAFAALATLSFATTAHATIIAQEDFNVPPYTAGSLGSQNPAATGFTGSWNSGGWNVVNTGLAFAGNAALNPIGGTGGSNGHIVRSSNISTRSISGGTTGDTFWVRYLFDSATTDSEFTNLSTSSGSGRLSPRVLSNAFSLAVFDITSGATVSSTLTPAAGTNVVIMLLQLNRTGSANDTVRLWLNPTGPGLGKADITISDQNFFNTGTGFSQLNLNYNGAGAFDQFIIGTNASEVGVAVPEPNTLALLSIGLLGLGSRRRR